MPKRGSERLSLLCFLWLIDFPNPLRGIESGDGRDEHPYKAGVMKERNYPAMMLGCGWDLRRPHGRPERTVKQRL